MAGEHPLVCSELVQLVTDYLEGILPLGERARFEAHLDECPDCVVYVDQMRSTLRVIGEITEEDLPGPARATLLAAFRDWHESHGGTPPDRPPDG